MSKVKLKVIWKDSTFSTFLNERLPEFQMPLGVIILLISNIIGFGNLDVKFRCDVVVGGEEGGVGPPLPFFDRTLGREQVDPHLRCAPPNHWLWAIQMSPLK